MRDASSLVDLADGWETKSIGWGNRKRVATSRLCDGCVVGYLLTCSSQKFDSAFGAARLRFWRERETSCDKDR